MTYQWQSLKAMATSRVFSTPVELNGKLYVVGGCDVRGIPLDSLEVYDPDSDSWTKLPSMPTKRAGAFAVGVAGKLVVLGGVSTSQQPLDAVEIFNTETKEWESKGAMKDKLLGLSGQCRDGKVLVVGGMGIDTNPKDYFIEYDVSKDLWKGLPPMPTPRYATFSFLIHDKLYVIGGRQGKVPVAAFEMFDFSENKWQKLDDIKSKRVFALYAHSDKHIFSLGGLNQDAKKGFSDVTEVYDIEKGQWKVGKPMPTKRGDFAAAYLGGKVIAAGGLGNNGAPMTAVEAYDETKNSWSKLADLPTTHCSCAFITFLDKLHVIGGLSTTTSGPTAAMEALSFTA